MKNIGNVSVKDGKLVDDHTDLSSETFALAPGEETEEITYTYTVTQKDVDDGEIVNVVKANATAVRGDNPKEVEATATVTTEEAKAELSITKSASPTSGVAVGATVTYTVVVKNIGNVSVKAGKLEDDHADLSDKTFELAPGKSASFTYTYTVTQKDVDDGEIVNTVKANATAVRGDDPKEVEANATVTAEEAAAKISITKSANPTSNVKVDDTVTYTVVVKNIGNVTVKDGKLEDDHVDLSGETFELAPGKSATFTYTYTVTQKDVDDGEIVNTVKANATAVRGDDPKEVTATATVTAEAAAAKISITKSADPTSGVNVDDTISYTVVVTNTGNVTVKDGKLVDDHADLSDKTFELAPKEKAEFTYTYKVTQKDFDAGEIVNVVKANATAVRGNDPKEVEATATVTAADAEAKISITKTADPTSGVNVGDTITYTVVVENVGNVTVKDGKLVDDHADLSGKTFKLAPKETAEFTYTYTVTQKDFDAGEIVNVVKANATAVRGDDPKEVETTATVTAADAAAKISITKTADPTSGVKVGDKITYTVVVKNEGNVTVKDGKLEDDHADLSSETFTLAPKEKAEFTYTYTVIQEDVDAGKIVNIVKANATAVRGDDPEEVEATATVTAYQKGSLKTTKVTTSTPKNGKAYALGEEITYKITVTNNGNVTVTNITVKDDKTGDEWTIDSLAPGETKEFTPKPYVVTEADILQGEVVNTATAKGESPDPKNPEPEDEDKDPEPTDEPNPHLTIDKTTTSKSKDPKGYAEGEEITYKITVKNDGNLTITDITVKDKLTGDNWTIDSMAPGDVKTYEASYIVKAKDVKRGTVVNVATVEGTSPDPDNPDVKDRDEEPNPTVGYYKLTIEYVYQDGTEAAETYTEEELSAGDNYNVKSPTIPGYHPSIKIVQGTMPKRDVTITVIYVPNQDIITIDDFITPLGLGLGGINAGETIE